MNNQNVKEKYNKEISDKFGNDYEKNRWFKDDFTKSGYDAMFKTIEAQVTREKFATCLELGPGHGTWTSLLLKFHPGTHFDLVDISSEMLRLAKLRFKNATNLSYFESDFLEFSPNKTYDFFFSSRAIEYIDDKEKMLKKINALLNPNGGGFIITKTPKYFRMKLMGRKVSQFHSGQIETGKLKNLLEKCGFTEIEIMPVTFVWPFWRSAKKNRCLFGKFGQKKMGLLSKFFSESYAIKFKKK